MKVVILAGGIGSRISEESQVRPKPMIEIGGQPILWHIMKIYGEYGFTDFVICLGYKGYVIKEYFANYFLHRADVTFDLPNNQVTYHGASVEPWRVTLVDTGAETQTGGRLKRVRGFLDHETFLMTYGDGVGNVDIPGSIARHRAEKRLATVTAVRPPGRFGALAMDGSKVSAFLEKPKGDGGYISGGFFVLEPQVIDRIAGDDTAFEMEPLQGLAADGQLTSYIHDGFWQPMDTLREKKLLEDLWATGDAPWKVWK